MWSWLTTKAVYDPQNVFNQNFPIDPVL